VQRLNMLFQAWYVRVPPPAACPWRRDTHQSKQNVARVSRTIEDRAGTMPRCAVGTPARRVSDGSGRRGSNPQLQPCEGAGSYLNFAGERYGLRYLSTIIFERCQMAIGSHPPPLKVAWTQVIQRRRQVSPGSLPGTDVKSGSTDGSGVVRVRTPSAPYVAWLSSAVSANVCRVSDRPRRGRAFWRAIRRKDAAPKGSYGAASAYGWVGQLALVDRAPSRGRVPLASCFVPTMHRATPGTRTLPSFSNALTFAMAFARIRSRAGSSTC
jgi:hypothetical protein